MSNDINFLGTIPLGKINFCQPKKSSQLTPVLFPGEDADKTEAIDTLGVSAFIDVRGTMTGDYKTIQSQLYDIRNIMDGMQTSSIKFKSPFVNGKRSSLRRLGNIGTNTSVVTKQLHDSEADFSLWNVSEDDKVKNLITGEVATILGVSTPSVLILKDYDIFTKTGTPYALTGTINVKVLDFNYKWELPGLSFCRYDLTLIQVN